jgi:predicted SprT family Zn-dependent metalloprotease
MRPTLQYIEEKFEYFNNLCFGGILTMPPIRLTLRYATMGCTKFDTNIDKNGNITNSNFSIEISIRKDLPEEEYIDTIIHEMIHYYIFSNNLHDTSLHGDLFKAKMNEIMEKFGIRVSIAFNPSDEDLVKERSHPHYVCVIDFADNTLGMAVVAKNKLFSFWDAISEQDKVRDVKWFISDRAIFRKFPTQVSLGCLIIDADKVHHYLTGALELERVNNIIRVKGN